MEMQDIMAHLIVKTNASQVKMDASRREKREELLTKMQTNEEGMDAKITVARIEDKV
jgi:hypothetical protein